MKSTYESRNHANGRDRDSQPVGGNRKVNWSGFNIDSLVKPQLSDVTGGTRIGSWRIGNFDVTTSLVSLVKSSKVTRVHSSVVTTARAYRAPAADFAIFSQNRKSEFSFDCFNIVPINDGGGERISDAQRRVGEEKIRSVHYTINSMAKDKANQNWGSCSGNLEINVLERSINHSHSENVGSKAVRNRATTPKNLGVTTNSFKCLEGSSVHE